jgi:hypothetical protein
VIMYCPSTKLSAGNSCGDAKALERSRDDLSGPTLRSRTVRVPYGSARARYARWALHAVDLGS